jgi:hypothetical protein
MGSGPSRILKGLRKRTTAKGQSTGKAQRAKQDSMQDDAIRDAGVSAGMSQDPEAGAEMHAEGSEAEAQAARRMGQQKDRKAFLAEGHYNKSMDSAGLAALIKQQQAGAIHDNPESQNRNSGGKARPPSIDLAGGPGNPFAGDVRVPPDRCQSSELPAPEEQMMWDRPPFANFESKQRSETWSVMTGDLKAVTTIQVERNAGYEMAVAGLSAHKKSQAVVAVSKSGEVHTYNLDTCAVIKELSQPQRLPLTSVAYNCDGTLIATGGCDKVSGFRGEGFGVLGFASYGDRA